MDYNSNTVAAEYTGASQSSNISYPNCIAETGSTNWRERKASGWVTGC